ncbi:unnamed protein product, partial [marine sediment metagenome]
TRHTPLASTDNADYLSGNDTRVESLTHARPRVVAMSAQEDPTKRPTSTAHGPGNERAAAIAR